MEMAINIDGASQIGFDGEFGQGTQSCVGNARG
jgi:hypothetical protein